MRHHQKTVPVDRPTVWRDSQRSVRVPSKPGRASADDREEFGGVTPLSPGKSRFFFSFFVCIFFLALTSTPRTSKAQEVEDKLELYIKELTEIIRANMDDPVKALESFGTLIEKKRADIELVGKTIHEKEDYMTDDQRMQYQAVMEEKFKVPFQELEKALAEFVKKHPEHGKTLSVYLIEFVVALDGPVQ